MVAIWLPLIGVRLMADKLERLVELFTLIVAVKPTR